MRAVGVKNLKAQLSEYLRLVKTGETILITEREKVIAQITPTARQDMFSDNTDQMLDSLEERGAMTLRSETMGSNDGVVLSPPLSFVLPVTSQEILDLLREE